LSTEYKNLCFQNWDLAVCSHEQGVKVLIDLFQKVAGLGAVPHKIGISLLLAFLFVPLMAKRKAAREL
jgi:hypothetical protein